MKKIWFDTEFIDDGKTVELISIGLVHEDGHELYMEHENFDSANASGWVKEHVVPKLTGVVYSTEDMQRNVLNFVGEHKTEFWAYYAAYDWVVLCQLFGSMMNLPTNFPKHCMDLKQLCVSKGNPRLPNRPEDLAHRAITDARWVRDSYFWLMDIQSKGEDS